MSSANDFIIKNGELKLFQSAEASLRFEGVVGKA